MWKCVAIRDCLIDHLCDTQAADVCASLTISLSSNDSALITPLTDLCIWSSSSCTSSFTKVDGAGEWTSLPWASFSVLSSFLNMTNQAAYVSPCYSPSMAMLVTDTNGLKLRRNRSNRAPSVLGIEHPMDGITPLTCQGNLSINDLLNPLSSCSIVPWAGCLTL